MKDMERSIRRHHRARIKNNWKNKLRYNWFYRPEDVDEEWIGVAASMLTITHTPCSSCIGHINDRVYQGTTLQEQCNDISYYEQLNEL